MSILRRGPTTFRFVTDLPPDPVTRRRTQTSTTFHGSAKDAKLAHAAWLIDVKGPGAANLSGSSSITFHEVAGRYLATIRPNVSASTYGNRERDVRLHLAPLHDLPIKSLKVAHFEELYLAMQSSGTAPSMIANVHGTARMILKFAVRREWLVRNVVEGASVPKIPHSEPWAPETEDLHRLLAHLETHDQPLYVYVDVCTVTGARSGEISALRWMDVDLDAGTIVINGSIDNAGRRKTTKTERVRRVHIDEDTVTVLKKWRAETGDLEDRCYLFSSAHHHLTPWTPGAVGIRLARHRANLGLTTPVTMRSIRHYVATNLIGNGVDVVTVAKRLGHANPAVTLNVYASAIPRNDKAAAELLRGLRKGKGSGDGDGSANG